MVRYLVQVRVNRNTMKIIPVFKIMCRLQNCRKGNHAKQQYGQDFFHNVLKTQSKSK